MTFCELFVLQGVLQGLFGVFLHFLTLQAPTAAAIAAEIATGEVRAGAGGLGLWIVVCGRHGRSLR